MMVDFPTVPTTMALAELLAEGGFARLANDDGMIDAALATPVAVQAEDFAAGAKKITFGDWLMFENDLLHPQLPVTHVLFALADNTVVVAVPIGAGHIFGHLNPVSVPPFGLHFPAPEAGEAS